MARRESSVKGVIMDATERLLADRRFDELTVGDILKAADVARGSFYFNFAGKQEVLAALVDRAIARGQSAAEPWLTHEGATERRDAVRASIAQGAQLWAEQAPVLRAIVENWRTDATLTEVWLRHMASFAGITTQRLEHDRTTAAVETQLLANALTWLGERLYYLAAVGVPPFDDRDKLVDTLTHFWMSAAYGDTDPRDTRLRGAAA
jgi:AcrR family transcriptional regulator